MEAVVKAALSNNSSGKDSITFLLDHWGAEILITEAVVEAAASNHDSGEDVMKVLLRRRGSDVWITEAVVKAAARSTSQTVMTVLLGWREDEAIEALARIGANEKIEILGPKLFRVKSAREWNYHALRKGMFRS